MELPVLPDWIYEELEKLEDQIGFKLWGPNSQTIFRLYVKIYNASNKTWIKGNHQNNKNEEKV